MVEIFFTVNVHGPVLPTYISNFYSISNFVHLSNLDINECAVRNGGCTQTCVNKVGSFECRCKNGYTLYADKKTCGGMQLDPNF